MRIVCDRCRKNVTKFEDRKGWKYIELSEKSYGKIGDYYLCVKCSDAFYLFLNNKAGEQE